MKKYKDLTNKRFNKLLAIRISGIDKNNKPIWECICDCGNTYKVKSSSLVSKNTQSCGCLRKELLKNNNFCKTHGESNTRIYNIWHGIKQRCLNPESHDYKHYGGKGITICEEWKDFSNFNNWSLNNGYSEKLTIDRMDNNKGYCNENCRWVTMKMQQNNRSNNVLITYQNETKTISQWAEEKGINKRTLSGRYHKGWKDEKLFRQTNKRYYCGEKR